jgi:hypothetical protein
VNTLEAACQAKVLEYSAAIKAQVQAGEPGGPNATVRRILAELRTLQAELAREIRRLHLSVGISDAEIEAAERELEADRLPNGTEFWQQQILQLRPTEDLDAQAEAGLEALLGLVDPKWLRKQAEKPYRLGPSFLTQPLHIVNNVRVGTAQQGEGPQRFARMLLLCEDHLKKEWTLDFHSAAMFVSEVAILGNSLKEIAELGREAARKLAALPHMPDDMVSSTIFELLVGAACARKRLSLQMISEDRSRKVPDYRIDRLGVPASIECKRRLGLTQYELAEASHVETLYRTVREPLRGIGFHGSLEASFNVPATSVSPANFARDVLAAAKRDQHADLNGADWGTLAIRPLLGSGSIPGTRLYSPDFLQRTFDWAANQDQWDGILCEVDRPRWIAVEKFKSPICLKWRCESAEALTKKARGITSLWADAVRQIPDGEIGFVYIAYPEGARAAVADSRTRHILEYMGGQAWHRWSVRIPASIITRLYARSVGSGCPDLIENSLPGAQPGEEFWLARLPTMIFTRQFE